MKKVKDIQFARDLLINEMDLPSEITSKLLNYDIEVTSGEPDTLIDRGSNIVYQNPSSIANFLFHLMYRLLQKYLDKEVLKDKLGLGLLSLCQKYVYNDPETEKFNGPPILVSFEKTAIPKFIISELLEPLTGKIKRLPIFYIRDNSLDICEVVNRQEDLIKWYNLPRHSVPFTDFPIIVTNLSINNHASRMSSILTLVLGEHFGENRAKTIIKTILLDETSGLTEHLMTLLYMLTGDDQFVIDFMNYLLTYVSLSEEEVNRSFGLMEKAIEANHSLNHIKLAWPDGGQKQRVNKQWSQWSMMMGLIEKQLTPMRGSMWPATENLKPIEDQRRKVMSEHEKEKGSQLNFEEMLEIARDEYDHNARPGTLIENMLKDNRVWKA